MEDEDDNDNDDILSYEESIQEEAWNYQKLWCFVMFHLFWNLNLINFSFSS